jgi:hypothetical protein
MRVLLLALFLVASALGAPARAADREGTALAFILLREAKLPDAEGVRARLEKRLGGRLTIDGMEADDRGKEGVILLHIAGGTAIVGLIDAPLPKGQVDDLCAVAWFWKSACAEVDKHHAQLTVSVVKTSLDRLDTSLLLTDLMAAAMEGNDNAIASYWRAVLRPRDMFLKASSRASRAAPPVWLWVDFRLSGGEQGVSMSTAGLDVYGLRELEVKDVKRPPMEVFDLITSTATYLVRSGPVIKDGDTIGAAPDLGIVVRYGQSYWREGAEVYRVVWTK